MPVYVTKPERAQSGSKIPDDKYEDGTAYHVDESGFLHIRGKDANIATYAQGQWASAVVSR